MTTKTLLLVDGSSYLYRAYHALPDLRSPDGFPTGAIHGMVAMVVAVLFARYPEYAVKAPHAAQGGGKGTLPNAYVGANAAKYGVRLAADVAGVVKLALDKVVELLVALLAETLCLWVGQQLIGAANHLVPNRLVGTKVLVGRFISLLLVNQRIAERLIGKAVIERNAKRHDMLYLPAVGGAKKFDKAYWLVGVWTVGNASLIFKFVP